MIFSLYFRTLLSLSLSFILHAFNLKKHLHSFLTLLTTTTTINNNNNNSTDNNDNKLLLKCQLHPPNMNSSTNSSHVPLPLPRPPIHDLMVCTESSDERIADDDHECNDGEDDEFEDGCLRSAEGRENTFPPPLSSLDGNGHPNFILLPARKNGRLQLSKVRIKRPEILCATREDGRLRLYLVPDIVDDEMEEEEEIEQEEVVEEEISTIIESEESEEEEEIMLMDESSRNEEDDKAREWKLGGAGDNNNNNDGGLYIRRCHSVGDNEKLVRKCHQMVNHTASMHYRHNLYGSHHHLHHMFGVGIA